MIPYVFLALFAAAAVINLTGAKIESKKLSNISKPALLLCLFLYCLFAGLPDPDLLLVFALIACWIGDVLLMLKRDLWFVIGGVSFLAGHFLLIFVFANRLDSLYGIFVPVLCFSLVYAAAACVLIYFIRKTAPKAMLIPLLFYLICNGVMNAFALLCLFRSGGVAMRAPDPGQIRQTVYYAVSYLGAILFFLSDCALFLLKFGDGKPRFYKTNFFVMLTYISGVCLITLGLTPAWG